MFVYMYIYMIDMCGYVHIIYICVYIYIHLYYILTSLCGRKKRGSHHPTPQLTDF